MSDISEKGLVLWKYCNPYINNRELEIRLFYFGEYKVKLLQDPQKERNLYSNTGSIVWDGSYILSSYIYKSMKLESRSCIELGAGCALVSMVAWLKGGIVTSTDLAKGVELIDKNIQSNIGSLAVQSSHLNPQSIKSSSLEWGSDNDLVNFQKFDYIFGSEIVYLKQSHDNLLKTLKHLSNINTRIYFVYYLRGLGEKEFIHKAQEQGFGIVEIEIDDPEFVSVTGKYVFIEMKLKT